ncbi:hypothetical protein [Spirillospora sp. CA-128828]|uniref:hypothetical protein n=1 Tax=Spirillospora sp. CA-128828 TaxID=3240033 RepID=UPI003D8D9455
MSLTRVQTCRSIASAAAVTRSSQWWTEPNSERQARTRRVWMWRGYRGGERCVRVAHRARHLQGAGQGAAQGELFHDGVSHRGTRQQSGHGRELGLWGLESFLQTKSLQLP